MATYHESYMTFVNRTVMASGTLTPYIFILKVISPTIKRLYSGRHGCCG